MGKVIAVANLKGGVAKTTTVQSLAAGLSKAGHKVLAVDCDSQSNLTENNGIDASNLTSITDLLYGDTPVSEAIIHLDNLPYPYDLIPSDISLCEADRKFTQTGKEFLLKQCLEDVMSNYSYILLDCPPNLGLLTVNAMMVADEVLVPIYGKNALRGFEFLEKEIELDRKFGNPNLKISGLLLTMYSSRLRVSSGIRSVAEDIAQKYGIKVFDTVIHRSTKVEEACFCATDIIAYDENGKVAQDYLALIEEMGCEES